MANDENTNPWDEYDRLIGLHKIYFEYLLKAAGFSFGLIGVILVYVVDAGLKASSHPWIAVALPALISFGTCIVFSLGVCKTVDLSAKVHEAQIRLGMHWRPHV